MSKSYSGALLVALFLSGVLTAVGATYSRVKPSDTFEQTRTKINSNYTTLETITTSITGGVAVLSNTVANIQTYTNGWQVTKLWIYANTNNLVKGTNDANYASNTVVDIQGYTNGWQVTKLWIYANTNNLVKGTNDANYASNQVVLIEAVTSDYSWATQQVVTLLSETNLWVMTNENRDVSLRYLLLTNRVVAGGFSVGDCTWSMTDGLGWGVLAIGRAAGSNFAGGNHLSVFLGPYAGFEANNAEHATFVGAYAGQCATNALESTFIGQQAGNSAEYARDSVFVGEDAGRLAISSAYSVFVGAGAAYEAETNSRSVFIGYRSGFRATNANHSVFIGSSAGEALSRSNTLCIDVLDLGTNGLIYGEFDTHYLRINGFLETTGTVTSLPGFYTTNSPQLDNWVVTWQTLTNCIATNQLVAVLTNDYAADARLYGNITLGPVGTEVWGAAPHCGFNFGYNSGTRTNDSYGAFNFGRCAGIQNVTEPARGSENHGAVGTEAIQQVTAHGGFNFGFLAGAGCIQSVNTNAFPSMSSGSGGGNFGYLRVSAEQHANGGGAYNFGYLLNSTQTVSGLGSFNLGYLNTSVGQSNTANGSFILGGDGTVTHDYAVLLGAGLTSTDTNAVFARMYYECGSNLSTRIDVALTNWAPGSVTKDWSWVDDGGTTNMLSITNGRIVATYTNSILVP